MEAQATQELKIKEYGKQFLNKKTNRFNIEECKIELKRLEGSNQKCSQYYAEIRSRLAELS